MAKTVITKEALERHRMLYGRAGFPPGTDYLVLDGTRAQIENWQPWKDFKTAHPDYIFYYINIDEENGDPTKFDMVNYARQLPPEMGGSLMGTWNGLYPGHTMVVWYNDYMGQVTTDIQFVRTNVENSDDYIIFDNGVMI